MTKATSLDKEFGLMHLTGWRGKLAWALGIVAVLLIVMGLRSFGDGVPARVRGGGEPQSQRAAARVNEALGLHASTVASLAVERAFGGEVTATVPLNGRLQQLRVKPHSVRARHYRIKVQGEDGSFSFVDPQPVRTYRGYVQGAEGSVVAASLADDGWHARILMADGTGYWIEPVGNVVDGTNADAHAVYRDEDVIPTLGTCDAHVGLRLEEQAAMASIAEAGAACGGTLCVAEVACDADVEYFLRWGSVAAVENRINSVINAMNAQYERDVAIQHVITTIVVRTAEPDPYTATGAENLLYQFRDEWIANQGGIQRDAAQLFTGRTVDGSTIGIAWLNAVCSSYAYSVVESDFNENFSCATDLSAHELGHNWSADHCSCGGSPSYTMNPYITCANQFHPDLTIPEVIAFRDGRTCLEAATDCLSDADCDDGLFCTGVETCPAGICQSSGDPCPGEDCDEATATCVPPICNNDGFCSDEEDCDNCPNDCFAGAGSTCGNGVCETGAGEHCVNCPADCNGVQKGKPSGRYCCGNGGVNSVDCGDSRCTAGGTQCTASPGTPSCCGDGICQGIEDVDNCATDCAVSCTVDGDCDDGDECTFDACLSSVCVHDPVDCDDGDACTFDRCVSGSCFNDPISCSDGDPCTDDLCDPVDGCTNLFPACGLDDGCCGPSCLPSEDPDCGCGAKNTPCTADTDCCSGACKRSGRCR